MTWVLLHGFTGDPRAFDAVARGLVGRVVAPLLPGHGPRPDPVGSWDEEVERLAGWLENEGVRGAHLVAYSLGGRLGWSLLERDDLFARATLIGAHRGLDYPERASRRAADRRFIDLLEDEGLEAFVAAWEALTLFESQRSLAPGAIAKQRGIRLSHTATGLANVLRSLGLAEMPQARAPRVPVQLVVGGLDARHLALARSLDHPLRIVPRVGHNVLLEAPAALAETLR